MASERSFVYELRSRARVICPLVANEKSNRFIIGTCNLRVAENEIHIIDFDEQELEVQSLIYGHKHEIRSLSPCPNREDLILTSYQIPERQADGISVKQGVTLWRFNDFKFPDRKVRQPTVRKTPPILQQLGTLDNLPLSPVQNVMWEPLATDSAALVDKIAVVDQSQLKLYSLANKGTVLEPNATICPSSTEEQFGMGAWNPHNVQQIAVAAGKTVNVYDVRSASTAPGSIITNANTVNVRSLAYNPNKANYTAVVGDDCSLRLFDMRNTAKPLLNIREHSHWIWSIAFNSYHDQLLLTGGSDELVALFNAQSIYHSDEKENTSSSISDNKANNPVPLPPRPAEKILEDGLLDTFEQHDDSVYGVCWSMADPWVFASISYDGRVVLNSISEELKMKILQI